MDISRASRKFIQISKQAGLSQKQIDKFDIQIQENAFKFTIAKLITKLNEKVDKETFDLLEIDMNKLNKINIDSFNKYNYIKGLLVKLAEKHISAAETESILENSFIDEYDLATQKLLRLDK